MAKEESKPSKHIPTPLTWLLHLPLHRSAWQSSRGRWHSALKLVIGKVSPHPAFCSFESWMAILSSTDGAWPSCKKDKVRDSFAQSFRSTGSGLLGFSPQLLAEQPPPPTSYSTMRTYSFPASLLLFLLLHDLHLDLKHTPYSLEFLHQIDQSLIPQS